MQPSGLITLTTDFGQRDGYVAIMKGVMLSITPAARLIDYTHEVEPQNIAQAAYLVQTGHAYFPAGTIHLVVVDPGVGTERRAVAMQTPAAIFVAPDNGTLSLVWHDALRRWDRAHIQVVELSEQRWWRPEISPTFHGRDIFAPVAAHLAGGRALAELGSPLEEIQLIEKLAPARGRGSTLHAQIIHVDRFGNCITNVTATDLAAAGISERLSVSILDQTIGGLFRTYADGFMGAPMALIGSGGYLELAVRMGNAARMLGVGLGDPLRITAAP